MTGFALHRGDALQDDQMQRRGAAQATTVRP